MKQTLLKEAPHKTQILHVGIYLLPSSKEAVEEGKSV